MLFLLVFIVFFILCIYPLTSIHVNRKYLAQGIEIGRAFDKLSLYEELKNRKFSYPLLKGIRPGYNGWTAIEGRNSIYVVSAEETKLFMKDFKDNEWFYKEYFSLLEMKIIKAYLNKFFNGAVNIPINIKLSMIQIYVVKALGIMCIAVVMAVFSKMFFEDYEIFCVRTGYLEGESDKYTVEEVFEDFFNYTDWTYSKENGTRYVTFHGNTKYNDETISMDIRFKISDGEYYPVDNICINDEKIKDSEINDILTTIFNGYE